MIWRYFNEDVRRELGETPESLLSGARLIKSNPVRRVWRNGEYFIKESLSGGSRAASEFDSALLLKSLHINVIDYLAVGVEAGRCLIVSRAFPDALCVYDYYYRNFINGAEPGAAGFRRKFAVFLNAVIASGIFHPDFHFGNVLYSARLDEFALVDVYKVRRGRFYDCFRRHLIYRVIMELSEGVSDSEMLELIAQAGIPRPERFLPYAKKWEQRNVDRNWPKRKRQILSDYGKYIRVEGTLHRVLDQSLEPISLDGCEVISADGETLKRQLLEHFYLQFCRIAHPRIAAVDYEQGKLYREVRR